MYVTKGQIKWIRIVNKLKLNLINNKKQNFNKNTMRNNINNTKENPLSWFQFEFKKQNRIQPFKKTELSLFFSTSFL